VFSRRLMTPRGFGGWAVVGGCATAEPDASVNGGTIGDGAAIAMGLRGGLMKGCCRRQSWEVAWGEVRAVEGGRGCGRVDG
jgi:hypothetical protein